MVHTFSDLRRLGSHLGHAVVLLSKCCSSSTNRGPDAVLRDGLKLGTIGMANLLSETQTNMKGALELHGRLIAPPQRKIAPRRNSLGDIENVPRFALVSGAPQPLPSE
jgi:hypothetical protein